MMERAIAKNRIADNLIKQCDELGSMFPSEKAGAMDWSIRKSPQAMLAIGDKVGGRNDCLPFHKHIATNGAATLAVDNQCHRI
jgi:hypothetical protein